MNQSATPDQIRKIHALARNAGLDEDMRRDAIALASEGRTRSSKDLTVGEAIKVIDRLKLVAGDRARPARAKPARAARGALDLQGPFAAVCRALWISGWHLGVVRDRADTALVAFVKRQTCIDHVAWVRDPADARRVIEALKKWLSREAGVEWRADDKDAHGRKLAVYLALRRLLTAAGVDAGFVEFPGRIGVLNLSDARLDELTRAGGDRLRATRKAT